MSLNHDPSLTYIEVNPELPPKHSIILLHGLGADGNDFVPAIAELRLPSALAVRFVFPHAPIMPITINNGYEMRAWYDIVSLAIEGHPDLNGITASVSLINQLIAQEVSNGIPAEKIMLAGFSQGAVIALTAGLRYSERLGGIIALSGYLPNAEETLKQANPANHQLPIFISHGTEDPIVPYTLGKAAYMALKEKAYPVSWHSYPIGHSVCAPEINDISRWIQGVWM